MFITNDFFIIRIKELEKELNFYKKELKSIKKDSGPVFITSTGNYVSARNVTRHFHSALDKAGLPRMRFHDLRHTAATLLLKENVHPKVVQEMLGHSSIMLTLISTILSIWLTVQSITTFPSFTNNPI